MPKTIRVTILDDHQSIVDGYVYRLNGTPDVEVVATLGFGEELEPALKQHFTDVLILDVSVPTSAENPNSYPILHEIPHLLEKYPNLDILVISMHAERGLIRAVMDAGASGYILKDDQRTIRNLGNVVLSVADGGIHFSEKAYQLYTKGQSQQENQILTGRQLEALSLCAAYPDSTTAELANKLTVGNSTVRNLLSGAYVRLKVHNRSAAIAKARQLGLISPDSVHS